MKSLLVAACAVLLLGIPTWADSDVVEGLIRTTGGEAGVQSAASIDLIDAWNDTGVPATSWRYAADCFGFEYVPSTTYALHRIEFFTGEIAGTVAVSVLEDHGSGLPTGSVLGSVTYEETPPRRWQGAALVPPVIVTEGVSYYVRYQVVVDALTSMAESGTIIPHFWSYDDCEAWEGPGQSFAWMARFYGDTMIPVETTTWSCLKALYR